MSTVYKAIISIILLAFGSTADAQKFFNLTADEVRIDSVLPHFDCSLPLGDGYQDSTYTVTIAYPEYIDMSASDIRRYKTISGSALPATPAIAKNLAVSR